MSTVKFFVPNGKFLEVYNRLKDCGVKYYPIRRVLGGHRFEVEDHPIVSFLILKYDLNTLNLDDPMLY